jgi:hypothetical protein
MNDLAARVRDLAASLASSLPPGPLREEASAIVVRIDGPLRVAVAGRVKAGKSTLLNALVGERLAPTDAGECTRLVAWYVHGHQYRVDAAMRDGSIEELHFTRDDGALVIEPGDRPVPSIDHLRIAWPARALEYLTLVDTPGLSSLDDSTSARTRSFLAVDDDERGSPVDAVLYLMRHMHREDARFLDALTDRSIGPLTPATAIAVLSRADEIGAGRLDAMDSARRIAARYATDERVRRLCVAVVPVAALLAETAATLREDEVAVLRAVAALPAAEHARLVLTCDEFSRPWPNLDIPVDRRAALVRRLGLHGIRLATQLLRTGEVSTAPQLAGALYQASGVDHVVSVLRDRFLPRSRALKGASALATLRWMARQLPSGAEAARLAREVEALAAGSLELAELRLLHLVLGADTDLTGDEVDALVALARDGDTTRTSPAAAATEAERGRVRAAAPLTDGPTREACELGARLADAVAAGIRT